MCFKVEAMQGIRFVRETSKHLKGHPQIRKIACPGPLGQGFRGWCPFYLLPYTPQPKGKGPQNTSTNIKRRQCRIILCRGFVGGGLLGTTMQSKKDLKLVRHQPTLCPTYQHGAIDINIPVACPGSIEVEGPKLAT